MSTIPHIKERALMMEMIPSRDVEFVVRRLEATQSILKDRERELLEVKGPCSHAACSLHYAHSGPCNLPGKLA
ncbi:hypothetical protein PP640_gp45 [Arthrobacter phage Faja]|uniref:Uncharacterized protein n=1 Tax=Arthrobacter phage Faja TaxID=2419957 RepID=A0A3G2KG13_9CAUD|nr:hypothetical protein PP640_gp45 [Arthrobacter phage Faja]AYN57897.1 hypothetical protein PBI_FAJA_45 [Arthrobacter phage Faja]